MQKMRNFVLRRLKPVIFSLLVCLLTSLFAPTGAATASVVGEPRLRAVSDGDTVILTLTLAEGDAVCGFFAEIAYDGEILTPVRVAPDGDLGDGGYISCDDTGGRLKILGDGCRASFYGRILTVTFSLNACDPEDALSLVSLELCRWREGRICADRTELDSSPIKVETDPCQKTEGTRYDSGRVSVTAPVDGGTFAAGLEITLTSLPSGKTESYSVIRVLHLSDTTHCMTSELPTVGAFCVILHPIAYRREGMERGRGVTFVLVDGALCGDITEFRE